MWFPEMHEAGLHQHTLALGPPFTLLPSAEEQPGTESGLKHISLCLLASPRDKGEAVEYFTFALGVFSQTRYGAYKGQELVFEKPFKR